MSAAGGLEKLVTITEEQAKQVQSATISEVGGTDVGHSFNEITFEALMRQLDRKVTCCL